MKTETLLYAFVGFGAVLIVLSTFSNVLGVFTALGGSMAPTINLGDLVVTAGVNPADIKVGNIITFKESTSIVTHRVVGITDAGFLTRGDANNAADASIVKASQVIGVVQFSIPLAGYLFHYAKSFLGFVILVIIPGMIIIVGETKKIIQYKKASKFQASMLIFFGSAMLAAMLFSNMASSELYFSDMENVNKQFSAWMDFSTPINVTKYWTDTCFNRMDGPAYNSTFYLVYHNDTGKVTATNPGGFYIYINISNTPNITSLQITDDILGNILSSGDFRSKGGNSFQVALSSGEAITSKFTWDFDGTTLSATLKPGQKIKADKWIWAVFHIEYAIDSLTWDEATSLFPHLYTNQLTVVVNGQTHYSGANLTAHIKMVGKDFGKYGYSSVDLMNAPEPSAPPAIESLAAVLNEMNSTTESNVTDNSTFETNQSDTGLNETVQENTTIEGNVTELGLNETIPENVTIETNTTETGGNSTIETNTTEPGLNETTGPIANETTTVYPMVAGYNSFLVPDTWATSAFQLPIDYPLILDVSYVDAENNTITYAAGSPVEQSFDIIAGMTITINASGPFDIQ